MYVNIIFIYIPNLLFSDVKYVDEHLLINRLPWMNKSILKMFIEILNYDDDSLTFFLQGLDEEDRVSVSTNKMAMNYYPLNEANK